jgi:hypothetical protein
MIFIRFHNVRTEAPVSTPIHAKSAWLGNPGACDPRFRSLHFLGFKKRLKKTAWQLLVQHLIWIADRAGWKVGGNRKLRGRDLFYLLLGQLVSTFPD